MEVMKAMKTMAMQLSNINVDTELIVLIGASLLLQECIKVQNLSKKKIMELWELIDEGFREEVDNKKISRRQYNALHDLLKKPNSKVFYSQEEIGANILSFSWMMDYMSKHSIKGKKNVARFLVELNRDGSQRREAMSAIARAYNTNLNAMLRSV